MSCFSSTGKGLDSLAGAAVRAFPGRARTGGAVRAARANGPLPREGVGYLNRAPAPARDRAREKTTGIRLATRDRRRGVL